MKAGVEATRTAIQFHVKGATDGCLLNVGLDQFETLEKDQTLDKTNLKSNSTATQSNFMNTIKKFRAEDVKNDKKDKIKIKFDKLTKSENTTDNNSDSKSKDKTTKKQ